MLSERLRFCRQNFRDFRKIDVGRINFWRVATTLTQIQSRYRTEGTRSGTFGASKQPLNPRRIAPRDLLNDVAGCIHTSRRQVATTRRNATRCDASRHVPRRARNSRPYGQMLINRGASAAENFCRLIRARNHSTSAGTFKTASTSAISLSSSPTLCLLAY